MDNRRIDIRSEGDNDLRAALLLFKPPGGTSVAYRQDGARLILYWTDSAKATKHPYPFDEELTWRFVLGWLAHAPYGDPPDIDGSLGKGWRVSCGEWGFVGDEHSSYVAVEPAWALYGK